MRNLIIILALLAAITAPVGAQSAMIEGVPAYYWYLGCGPTAAGMVIGYWDGQGFDDLIYLGNQWEENKLRIQHMIASPGHKRDYYDYTPDRFPTAEDPLHEDDCVADFMMSSRDPLGQGIALVMYQYRGLSKYAEYCGYPLSSGGLVNYGDGLWELIIREIDAARPVELHVDSDGDGRGDHYVVAIGYDTTDGAQKIAFYPGGNFYIPGKYYNDVCWMDYQPFSSEYAWGIGAGTWFNLFRADQCGWGNGGDVDGDGIVSASDIDLLWTYINAELYSPDADINNDYRINEYDMHMLVRNLIDIDFTGQLRGTEYGDLDLDGDVDIFDFLILKENYGSPGFWSNGDVDGDGYVNIFDFLSLKENYGYVNQQGE